MADVVHPESREIMWGIFDKKCVSNSCDLTFQREVNGCLLANQCETRSWNGREARWYVFCLFSFSELTLCIYVLCNYAYAVYLYLSEKVLESGITGLKSHLESGNESKAKENQTQSDDPQPEVSFYLIITIIIVIKWVLSTWMITGKWWWWWWTNWYVFAQEGRLERNHLLRHFFSHNGTTIHHSTRHKKSDQ